MDSSSSLANSNWHNIQHTSKLITALPSSARLPLSSFCVATFRLTPFIKVAISSWKSSGIVPLHKRYRCTSTLLAEPYDDLLRYLWSGSLEETLESEAAPVSPPSPTPSWAASSIHKLGTGGTTTTRRLVFFRFRFLFTRLRLKRYTEKTTKLRLKSIMREVVGSDLTILSNATRS